MEISKTPNGLITDMHAGDATLAASWGKEVCMYRHGTYLRSWSYPNPILRCMYHGSEVVACDTEGVVYVGSQKTDTPCGGIQCLHVFGGCLVVGGWASRICLVTDRVEHTIESEKVVCSDLYSNKLIVGFSTKKVAIYDLREMRPVHTRKFGFMVRSVKITATLYAVGSTCGMVSVHGYGESWTFAAHAFIEDGIKHFCPVNVLCFAERLYSGGSDGTVREWNLGTRKDKILHKKSRSVSAMCIDGANITVGHSDVHILGDESNDSLNAMYLIKR